MKAYKIYNYNGNNAVFSFVELRDELSDEINVDPAPGMEIRLDWSDVPYLIEKKTGIIYNIGHAQEKEGGRLVAPGLKIDAKGREVRTGRLKTIAFIKS